MNNYETLYDIDGIIECAESFDCCLCKTIECCFNRMPCDEKEIYVNENSLPHQRGVTVDCHGSFSMSEYIYKW